jgi:agmatine deiminase
MITDSNTNFVFFSEHLKKDLTDQAKVLTDVLNRYQINHGFLKSTGDYYCRDYMPVQVNKDKFVQFVFYPVSYYKPKDYAFISNQTRILLDNNLPKPHYSQLILDGGNVVKSINKVIITDKVITDNTFQLSEYEILKELEKQFESEVIIIPSLKEDKTGHADGMVRFINENTILTHDPKFENDSLWEMAFLKSLKEHHLDFEPMPVFEGKEGTGIGIYINFLQVSNLIILPIFDSPKNKNDDAIKTLTKHFPDYNIEPVNADQIAEFGGVFNCASWNIIQ